MLFAIIVAAVCGGVITASFMKASCPFDCKYCRDRQNNYRFDRRA